MKKTACFLLALLLLCSLFTISGCAPSVTTAAPTTAATTTVKTTEATTTVATTSETASDYPEYLNPKGEFPITKEPVTLSVFTSAHYVGDQLEYDNNLMTKFVTDKTNIQFKWIVNSSTDFKTKLSLLMSTGEYPDVIFNSGFTLAEMQVYGDQGVLVDVSEMIDKYCVELPAIFDEWPAAKKMYTLNGGAMYDITAINECTHCAASQKMWLWGPWMEKLGLEMPTTIDEFYDVLVAFRDGDGNGDNIANEVPLAGSPSSWDANMDGFLMQPFEATARYLDDTGKIVVPQVTDNWKAGLKWLNKLYADGLMYPESLTMDQTQLQALNGDPANPNIGAVPGGWHGCFFVWGEDTNFVKYQALAPLVGPNGRQSTRFGYYDNFGTGLCITSACDYPEAAVRLADYMASLECTMFNQCGVEGQDWELAEKGELGLNGEQALYKQIVSLAELDYTHAWVQVGVMYRPASFRLGAVASVKNSSTLLEEVLYKASIDKYYPYALPLKNTIPPVIYNEADAAEIANLDTAITTYISEMTARFISGDANIDQTWDSYKAELETMGLSRSVELQQAAVDAALARQ